MVNAGFEVSVEGYRSLWNPDIAAQKAAVEFGKTIAKI